MSAKKFVTMIGIGIGILAIDYYDLIIWRQILGNNICLSPIIDPNVITQTICWGVSPTPFFVINVVAVGATIGYIYQIYKTIKYGW